VGTALQVYTDRGQKSATAHLLGFTQEEVWAAGFHVRHLGPQIRHGMDPCILEPEVYAIQAFFKKNNTKFGFRWN
jgi:hypothetical protein